ncbi:MAG TPA: NAD(P)H-quinone oxidoreductase [Burkholderiaceae bacterium]
MRAIEIAGVGGPEVLRAVVRARPVAGVGEAVVRVTASGVNRPDVLQRKGHYPVPPGASDIPGLEIAGVIDGGDAAALAAAGFEVGDRVCALVAGGGYAEYCAAPVGQMLPVPAGFSDVEAAALPENFFTVWSNVFDRGRLAPGEWLLVQGGSSGIGVTAIQLGRAFGARVIATAGSDDKCARCVELGADHAVNYRTEDFAARALEITGGKGVDVVLDMVAGDYVAREVSCLAEDGRIVLIAVQGGTKSQIDAGLVLRRRLTLTGSTLRPRPVAFKAAIAAALREKVWPLLETRQVQPVVQEVFPAEQAWRAHAAMEEGSHVGKLMLAWGT